MKALLKPTLIAFLTADNFLICEGIVALFAAYYVFHVSYLKSSRAAGLLLFIREVLLGIQDVMPARIPGAHLLYINSVLSD